MSHLCNTEYGLNMKETEREKREGIKKKVLHEYLLNDWSKSPPKNEVVTEILVMTSI